LREEISKLLNGRIRFETKDWSINIGDRRSGVTGPESCKLRQTDTLNEETLNLMALRNEGIQNLYGTEQENRPIDDNAALKSTKAKAPQRGWEIFMKPRNQQAAASWIFGSLLVLFLLWVFIWAPNELPEYKHRILAYLCAILAGFFAYFFAGAVTVTSKGIIPFVIRASGGFALFLIILWWWFSPTAAPVKVIPQPTPSTSPAPSSPAPQNTQQTSNSNYYYDFDVQNNGSAACGKLYEICPSERVNVQALVRDGNHAVVKGLIPRWRKPEVESPYLQMDGTSSSALRLIGKDVPGDNKTHLISVMITCEGMPNDTISFTWTPTSDKPMPVAAPVTGPKPMQMVETYRDSSTNLEWTKRDNGKDIDYQSAKAYCASLPRGSGANWRVPTIIELDKLIDKNSSGSYKIQSPFKLTGTDVWSTEEHIDGKNIWIVKFSEGRRVTSLLWGKDGRRVLCVR
jgi:hypothetical protein